MIAAEQTPEEAYEQRGNDFLREQLALLRKDPKLKKKLTLLRVECRGCDSTVLEVIATRPYWVVVKRSTHTSEPDPPDLYDRPEGLSGMEWGRLVAQRRRAAGRDNPIRRSPDTGFTPLTRAPDTNDRDGTRQLFAVCNCAQFERRTMWLYDMLAEAPRDGRTHVVTVSPPGFTR